MNSSKFLIPVLLLSLALPSLSLADNKEADAAHAKTAGTSGSASREQDKDLKTLTTAFGDTYFYPPKLAGEFKRYYEGTKFDGETLVESINTVKAEDGVVNSTVAQELPLARAIVDMMIPLTQKNWSEAWDHLSGLVKKWDKEASPDSQFETFGRRVFVALNNWGTDEKTKEKVVTEPKDKNMLAFFKALEIAREEGEKKIAEINKRIDLAASGNLAAKKELWGDANDKDSNSPKNKYAVGKNANSYINQLIDQGETDKAFKMMKALGNFADGHYNFAVNDENGKPKNLTFTKDDKEAAIKKFKDDKVLASTFVGHPHKTESGVQRWDWDKTKNAVAIVQPAPPQPATGGAAGAAAGAQVAAAKNDGQSDTATSTTKDGSALFATNCAGCHGPGKTKPMPSNSSTAAAHMSSDMPKGSALLPPEDQKAIVAFLAGG